MCIGLFLCETVILVDGHEQDKVWLCQAVTYFYIQTGEQSWYEQITSVFSIHMYTHH